MSSNFWILIVFIVYFPVLIGIAIFRVRPMDDMADYVLGGGR
jgi:Na+/proline symporter